METPNVSSLPLARWFNKSHHCLLDQCRDHFQTGRKNIHSLFQSSSTLCGISNFDGICTFWLYFYTPNPYFLYSFLKKKINVVFSLRKKSMLFFIAKSKHPFSPILFLFIASLSFARIGCKLITIRHISWSDSGYLWHNVTISLLSIQTIIDTSYQFSLSFLSAVIMMSSKAEFNFVKIAKFEELPCHETAQHVILRPITSSEETNLTFHYWDRTAGGDQGGKDFLLILYFI